MKIQGGNNGPIRPERTPDSRERDHVRREEKKQPERVERPGDRVEISPAARERLAKRLDNFLDRLRERRGMHIQPEKSPEDAHTQPVAEEPARVQPVQPEPAHAQPVSQEPAHVQPVPSEPAQTQPVEGEFHTQPVDWHRLKEVRNRILSGAYDLDHVLNEVARRILDRGDV